MRLKYLLSELIYIHRLLLSLGIDDPVDAVAIHAGGGLLGVLAAPVFMENGKEFVLQWIKYTMCKFLGLVNDGGNDALLMLGKLKTFIPLL